MIVGGRDCGHGFDWSIWQPVRDHRGNGQDFAVAKATEGNGYRDPKYRQHVASFDQAGLLHGAYHFAQPNGWGYADGQAEASSFLSVLAPTERFVVLDLEATSINAHETAQFVLGFWDQVIATGRFPRREQRVTYVGKWFTYEHTARIADHSVLWIPSYTAGYQPNVDPARIPLPAWSTDLWPEGWAIWQYSSSGTIGGVHPSDVNVATRQWIDAVKHDGLAPRSPQPFPEPERTDMAKPVFDVSGSLHYLGQGEPGAGWRHIDSPERANALAVAGEIELARVCKVGVGAGKPAGHEMDPDAFDIIDDTWNKFPVLDGPLVRS